FTSAGGVPASNLARWNGTAWSPLGGADGMVSALQVLPGGELIAAGRFQSIGGVAAAGVARWDGTAWSPLDAGLGNGALPAAGNAIALLPGGEIVVGGQFSTVGPIAAANVARWDGSSWSALGAGTGQTVYTLASMPSGDIIAGGSFVTAGGLPANRLARWNGSGWSAIGAGLGFTAFCMARTADDELAIGGSFFAAGGTPAAYLTRLGSGCAASATAGGAGCSGSGGPNVLTPTSLPWIGATYRTRATGMPAAGFGLSVFGLGTTTVPLASILPQGIPGCSLLVTPDLLELPVPVAGKLTTALPIPPSPALIALSLHHQIVAVEVDAQGAFTAWTSTNRLTMTFGWF
ncbi:MAG: hypothetical protein K8J09_01770, partial [Planctomycetes bacterium]|nr:hypothetical protein [Planctomycetota bacterium]